MLYRKIIPRKYGSQWYVNVPLDLRCVESRRRRQFDTAKEAADYAKQLTQARQTSLQFFFAMHPAALSEIAYRIKELGYERAIAALRRAKEAFDQSSRLANDVFEQFMEDKLKSGNARKRTLSTYRCAIKPLIKNNRPLGEIARQDIEQHLSRLGFTPAGIESTLRPIKVFFNWCVEAGLLEKSPAEKIKPPKVTIAEIKILKVDDVQKLMDAAKKDCPSIIPFLAFQLFAGLRAAEAARVTADAIKNGHIRIVGDATKLGVIRAIPISAQLQAWLDVKGCEFLGEAVAHDRLLKLKTKHAIAIPKNALRHSFCSYLYAKGTDIDFVAKAAGNSADILRKHYLGIASKEDGERFAAIMP